MSTYHSCYRVFPVTSYLGINTHLQAGKEKLNNLILLTFSMFVTDKYCGCLALFLASAKNFVGLEMSTVQFEQFGDKFRQGWHSLEMCRGGMYWTKDIEYGASRQEEKRKTRGEVHICSQTGHRAGMTEDDSRDRMRWKQVICYTDHKGSSQKRSIKRKRKL